MMSLLQYLMCSIEWGMAEVKWHVYNHGDAQQLGKSVLEKQQSNTYNGVWFAAQVLKAIKQRDDIEHKTVLNASVAAHVAFPPLARLFASEEWDEIQSLTMEDLTGEYVNRMDLKLLSIFDKIYSQHTNLNYKPQKTNDPSVEEVKLLLSYFIDFFYTCKSTSHQVVMFGMMDFVYTLNNWARIKDDNARPSTLTGISEKHIWKSLAQSMGLSNQNLFGILTKGKNAKKLAPDCIGLQDLPQSIQVIIAPLSRHATRQGKRYGKAVNENYSGATVAQWLICMMILKPWPKYVAELHVHHQIHQRMVQISNLNNNVLGSGYWKGSPLANVGRSLRDDCILRVPLFVFLAITCPDVRKFTFHLQQPIPTDKKHNNQNNLCLVHIDEYCESFDVLCKNAVFNWSEAVAKIMQNFFQEARNKEHITPAVYNAQNFDSMSDKEAYGFYVWLHGLTKKKLCCFANIDGPMSKSGCKQSREAKKQYQCLMDPRMFWSILFACYSLFILCKCDCINV